MVSDTFEWTPFLHQGLSQGALFTEVLFIRITLFRFTLIMKRRKQIAIKYSTQNTIARIKKSLGEKKQSILKNFFLDSTTRLSPDSFCLNLILAVDS